MLHSNVDKEVSYPCHIGIWIDRDIFSAMHKHASSQMNMQAVFLHVLGDALGSVVVMISALVIYFVEVSVPIWWSITYDIGQALLFASECILEFTYFRMSGDFMLTLSWAWWYQL